MSIKNAKPVAFRTRQHTKPHILLHLNWSPFSLHGIPFLLFLQWVTIISRINRRRFRENYFPECLKLNEHTGLCVTADAESRFRCGFQFRIQVTCNRVLAACCSKGTMRVSQLRAKSLDEIIISRNY